MSMPCSWDMGLFPLVSSEPATILSFGERNVHSFCAHPGNKSTTGFYFPSHLLVWTPYLRMRIFTRANTRRGKFIRDVRETTEHIAGDRLKVLCLASLDGGVSGINLRHREGQVSFYAARRLFFQLVRIISPTSGSTVPSTSRSGHVGTETAAPDSTTSPPSARSAGTLN